MKNVKVLLSALLVLVMLLGTTAALAEGYSVDVLEVKIWDNNQLAGLQQIADEWTAQSGVKVNIQVVDWDNYWTLLEAGASGGEMPDVFWMHSNNAQMYMGAQKLLDLTDYIAASDKIDLANYYPGITELYSLNDRNYAIAKDHDTIALLYNKAIFDQYGVAYPDETWTWDDYKAAAEAITEASGGEVYGAACNTTNDQDGYFNIIYDFGGYVISEDKKSSGWDNENTIAAMNFVGSLMDKAWAPQQLVAENGTDTLFKNRKVAMISQGRWMINSFYTYEGSEDYAWAVLPYADVNGNGQADEGERCSIYNDLGWAASATTKDPNAAWSLIEWFSTEEMQRKQSELGVTLAGYIGASDAFANAFPGMNIDAFLKMESEGTLIFRPYSKYTSRWSDQYQRELVDAWNNPAVMNDVLYNLAGEMNALLAQE